MGFLRCGFTTKLELFSKIRFSLCPAFRPQTLKKFASQNLKIFHSFKKKKRRAQNLKKMWENFRFCLSAFGGEFREFGTAEAGLRQYNIKR
jgi:hypothetical protein